MGCGGVGGVGGVGGGGGGGEETSFGKSSRPCSLVDSAF